MVAWEHRVALDERVDEARRNEATLQEEAKAIESRSYLPAWANLPLALTFVLGVALILLSLLYGATRGWESCSWALPARWR